MTVSALDPVWGDIQIYAYGGVYGRLLGQELRHRGLRELLVRATIYDSVHDPCRRGVFELDNSLAGELAPVHIGSHFAIWGREYDPVTESPTDWREVFLGGTWQDNRSVSGAGGHRRSYTVYEWVGNTLARNDGVLVFDEGADERWTEGPTLTEVAATCAFVLGISIDDANFVDTAVRVGAIIQSPNMSYWDLIEEAVKRTVERTGRRYFVRASRDGQSMQLLEMGATGVIWKLNDGDSGILSDVDLSESAEDIALSIHGVVEGAVDDDANTRQLYTADAEWADPGVDLVADPRPDFRTWLGRVHKVITPEGDFGQGDPETPVDQPAIQTKVDQELSNRSRTVVRVTTNSLMLPGVRRGDQVNITSLKWGIVDAPFFVESVVTTYENGAQLQTMDLVLDVRDG